MSALCQKQRHQCLSQVSVVSARFLSLSSQIKIVLDSKMMLLLMVFYSKYAVNERFLVFICFLTTQSKYSCL